jgi:HK97 family phage portal protein
VRLLDIFRPSWYPPVHRTAEPLATRHTFSAGGLLGHEAAGEWTYNVSELTALGLDVVTDCVTVIGDAVAGSEVGQWNGTQKIDPPSAFTLRPNPDQTRRDFLWQFAANLALYRSVYLEEARLGGQVLGVRLHCIESVLRQGDDYYVGGQRVQNPMRLVRSSVWPTLDPLTGSTINLARQQFAAALASAAYQSDFWQQGGAPSLVLKTDQPITSTQAATIKDDWTTARAATPGAPAVLPLGLQVQPLSADMGSEGAHTSSDKLGASIARYFKMPPGIVNVRSEAGPLTYSTVEQEGIHLVRYTIQPYCDVIGEALSSYLPGDYLLGDRIVLDPSKLMTADQNTRYNAYAIATGTGPGGTGIGWMRVSEVREREGFAPDPELDVRVASLSEGRSV